MNRFDLTERDIESGVRTPKAVFAPVRRLKGIGRVSEFHACDPPVPDERQWGWRDERGRWSDMRHASVVARCPFGASREELVLREPWRPVLRGIWWEAVQYTDRQVLPLATHLLAGNLPGKGRRGLWYSPQSLPLWACRRVHQILSIDIVHAELDPQLLALTGYVAKRTTASLLTGAYLYANLRLDPHRDLYLWFLTLDLLRTLNVLTPPPKGSR